MVLIGICVAIVLLYLIAIMPRMCNKPDDKALRGIYYAHRGLHDNQGPAPENSMESFKRAVNAGYGMEFDVQLTKDRIPVVFHDGNLKRVCGANGNVRDYSYKDLQKFTVFDSDEQIPLFQDVLNMVAGRVPLIVEIKVHENHSVVCQHVDAVLEGYKGSYCIESFHPQAVWWYKKHRPKVIRGQLSCKLNDGKKKFSLMYFFVTYLLTNFLCKPDFVAYDHEYADNISRRICRKLYKNLSVAWTIRSQNELDEAQNEFDLFIFEGFVPKIKD